MTILPLLQFTPRDRAWLAGTRAAWHGEDADPPADPELRRCYWAAYIASGIVKELSDQEMAPRCARSGVTTPPAGPGPAPRPHQEDAMTHTATSYWQRKAMSPDGSVPEKPPPAFRCTATVLTTMEQCSRQATVWSTRGYPRCGIHRKQ